MSVDECSVRWVQTKHKTLPRSNEAVLEQHLIETPFICTLLTGFVIATLKKKKKISTHNQELVKLLKMQ